jgi:hypothetical protein
MKKLFGCISSTALQLRASEEYRLFQEMVLGISLVVGIFLVTLGAAGVITKVGFVLSLGGFAACGVFALILTIVVAFGWPQSRRGIRRALATLGFILVTYGTLVALGDVRVKLPEVREKITATTRR